MKRIYTFLLAAMATTLCATAQSTGITHEYVDLGLPSGLRWATCNVGATSPEEYGNHYAWGETEPKESYSWDTYKYGTYSYNNDYSTLTKYNGTDGLTTLEAADDAATVNWGEGWRMFTIAELNELESECNWTWTDNYNSTGVAGYIVASKTNSNSIFLPAAGEYYNSSKNYEGKMGRYWTSAREQIELEKAGLYYFFQSTTKYYTGALRFYGCSVRPVIMVYGITVAAPTNGAVTADKEAYAGQEVTLTITPDTDYELETLSVKDADDNPITVEDNKFTMPASAVTVTATFKKKVDYTIIIASGIENGAVSVTSGATTANYGDEVELTVTPATGYELDVLTVKDADNNAITVSADNKFTMPASNVTVSATFKAKTPTALATTQALDLRTESGRVICTQEFQIFTLTGQNVTEMNGQLNGVYIVKVGDKAQKVVVK